MEQLCPERTLQVHFELWRQAKFIDNTVSVFLGNGDGTFQPELTHSSGGSWANAIAVADLNGDGRPDICCCELRSPGTPLGGFPLQNLPKCCTRIRNDRGKQTVRSSRL
jgi:FG-GAP-like repeat